MNDAPSGPILTFGQICPNLPPKLITGAQSSSISKIQSTFDVCKATPFFSKCQPEAAIKICLRIQKGLGTCLQHNCHFAARLASIHTPFTQPQSLTSSQRPHFHQLKSPAPYTTILIILPGTTMTFRTGLPSSQRCTPSISRAAFSKSAGSVEAGKDTARRSLPLTLMG